MNNIINLVYKKQNLEITMISRRLVEMMGVEPMSVEVSSEASTGLVSLVFSQITL